MKKILSIMTTNDLKNYLIKKATNLSRNQLKIYDTIINNNLEIIPFMNINELSKKFNINPSSIYRLTKKLGYSGYPNFQKEIKKEIFSELTFKKRLENNGKIQIEKDNYINLSLSNDLFTLRKILENNDLKNFDDSADLLFNSRKKYFFAVRSSSFSSNLFFYFIKQLDVNAINLNLQTGYFEEITEINASDLLIVINLPRYAKEPIKMMEYAKKRNSKIILITDSKYAPFTKKADILFLINFKTYAFFNNYVGVIAIMNAILTRLVKKYKPYYDKRLNEIEALVTNSEEFWQYK